MTKLSLIHEHGLGTTTAQTTGVGVGLGGGVGVGTARTQGTTQSVASANAAPPEMKQPGGAIMAMCLFGFAGVMFLINGAWVWGLIFGGIAAACTTAISEANSFNNEQYPRLRRTWEHTYQCDRCATRFVWGLPGTQAQVPRALQSNASERVLSHIRAGANIQAIAALREERGLGLAEAKTEVERIAADMR